VPYSCWRIACDCVKAALRLVRAWGGELQIDEATGAPSQGRSRGWLLLGIACTGSIYDRRSASRRAPGTIIGSYKLLKPGRLSTASQFVDQDRVAFTNFRAGPALFPLASRFMVPRAAADHHHRRFRLGSSLVRVSSSPRAGGTS
jgi:hypothetical protein